MLAVGKEGLRVLATRLPWEGEQTDSGAQQLWAPGKKGPEIKPVMTQDVGPKHITEGACRQQTSTGGGISGDPKPFLILFFELLGNLKLGSFKELYSCWFALKAYQYLKTIYSQTGSHSLQTKA